MKRLPLAGPSPVLLALALAAPFAGASDLKLAGVVAAELPYGAPVPISVAAGANLPVLLWADAGPGPVAVAGESIPLDLGPGLTFLFGGSTDAGGAFALAYPTPFDPTFAGLTAHLAALVLDPADPNGLDVSNGASLRFLPPVGAGASQGTLVGRRVALDGSGATDASGVLPLGASVLWSVASAPGGSAAAVDDAFEPLASFVPDLPGEYVLRLAVTQNGAVNVAETLVRVWALDFGTDLDGKWFPTATAFLAGTLVGPGPAGLTIDGTPVPLGGAGTFGPVAVPLAVGEVLDGLLVEVTGPGGEVVRARQTVGLGLAGLVASGAPGAALAHLDQAGFAEVAEGLDAALEQTDLSTYITGIPATKVANETGLFGFTIFSATVKFTGMTHAPDLVTTLVPTPGGVVGHVRLTNVKVTFDVWGDILEIPYSLSGDSTSSAVDIDVVMKLKPVGGNLGVDVVSTNVQLSGFTFDLYGFLGDVAQLFIIESWVKDQTVATLESEIGNQVGPLVQGLLSAFDFSIDLGPELGLATQVDVAFESVLHSGHGVTLGLGAQAVTAAPYPGAPDVTLYHATPSAAPVFGTTTPTGKAYAGALAASDDFLNLVLAALTEAGLLEGDLTQLFADPQGGGGQALTTDVLAVLFPGAGFDLFPVGTPVDLAAHGVMPPVARTTAAGPGEVRLDLGGLEVALQVPTATGSVPILRLVLDGHANLAMQVEADGTLAVTLIDSTFAPTVLAGFPGADAVSLQAGSDFLVQMLLPQLTSALGVIPVPSLETEGIALYTDEVGLFGGSDEYMGFWGGMVYTPPSL